MTELSEYPEQEAVIKPSDDKPQPEPKSRGGLWFAIIILLLILGMAGAGFYLFSQLRDKQEGLGGEVKTELTGQSTGRLVGGDCRLRALRSHRTVTFGG